MLYKFAVGLVLGVVSFGATGFASEESFAQMQQAFSQATSVASATDAVIGQYACTHAYADASQGVSSDVRASFTRTCVGINLHFSVPSVSDGVSESNDVLMIVGNELASPADKATRYVVRRLASGALLIEGSSEQSVFVYSQCEKS